MNKELLLHKSVVSKRIEKDMPKTFTCIHCGKDIVSYLLVGEICTCKVCHSEQEVPETHLKRYSDVKEVSCLDQRGRHDNPKSNCDYYHDSDTQKEHVNRVIPSMHNPERGGVNLVHASMLNPDREFIDLVYDEIQDKEHKGAAHDFIYILSNDSMPGLLKIGRTSRSVEERVREVSSATGIPSPFTTEYSIGVQDGVLAEKEIHTLLNAYRYNRQREFFEIDLEQAIAGVNYVCLKYKPIPFSVNSTVLETIQELIRHGYNEKGAELLAKELSITKRQAQPIILEMASSVKMGKEYKSEEHLKRDNQSSLLDRKAAVKEKTKYGCIIASQGVFLWIVFAVAGFPEWFYFVWLMTSLIAALIQFTKATKISKTIPKSPGCLLVFITLTTFLIVLSYV